MHGKWRVLHVCNVLSPRMMRDQIGHRLWLCYAGGAIFVDSGSQSNITASNFTLNTAGQSGGAVSQADSMSMIADSQFISNSGSTQGGAVFQNNMTGSVAGCRFFNNTGMTGVSHLLPQWARGNCSAGLACKPPECPG